MFYGWKARCFSYYLSLEDNKNLYLRNIFLSIINMVMADKNSVLNEALKAIEKQFGKGSIMRLWDNTVHSIVKTYHTGSYMIDDILWGGYPEGRIIEIYGPESSGKTTLALHAIAEVQKAGENAAFIDAEHALDPAYAKKLGVDVDNLVLAQPDYGEQAL